MPPERRGIRRDQVRMMVLDRKTGITSHDRFDQLGNYLKSGDVLVINSSRTLPAILKAKKHKDNFSEEVEVRLARRINGATWEALVVSETSHPGDRLVFSEDLSGNIIKKNDNSPLVTILFSKTGNELFQHIYSVGEPVRYEYINHPWELDYYQTVFAAQPGSVEMPSAGRAFSWELLFKLQRQGVKITSMQLHTGLSYLLDDKWDHSPEANHEEYFIPSESWTTIMEAKLSGGRIIAVGTTVVRALESAMNSGSLSGWTNLYITPEYQLKAADAIITGLHEPEASHLAMLSAFVEKDKLFNAYQEAILEQYLWHEFGDINLII